MIGKGKNGADCRSNEVYRKGHVFKTFSSSEYHYFILDRASAVSILAFHVETHSYSNTPTHSATGCLISESLAWLFVRLLASGSLAFKDSEAISSRLVDNPLPHFRHRVRIRRLPMSYP